MTRLLLIGLGGAVGSIARYLVSGYTQRWTTEFFPTGTLVVNLLGCLAVGFLAEWTLVRSPGTSLNMRLLLIVGVCGGFTTFSAFGWETFELLKRDELWRAALNVAGQLATGFIGVASGVMLARLV